MKKHLTHLNVVLLFIGSIVGSAVFIIPSIVAKNTSSPFYFLLAWIIAGLITIVGCITHAELALYLPGNGGQYSVLKHVYGSKIAKAYGWGGLLNFNSGGIACIAIIAATYLGALIGPGTHIRVLAIIFILLFTLSNSISLNSSEKIQTQFTIIRIVIILTLIVVAFNYNSNTENDVSTTLFSGQQPYPFVLAIIGALWAYDGWNNFTYVAGEIIDLRSAIYKSIPIGIVLVIILYTVFNGALIYVFPIKEIANADAVGSLLTSTVLNDSFNSKAIICAIVLCTIGSLNANIMSCSRLPHSMARDTEKFKWMGKINSRSGTPINALILQAVIASLLAWFISFEVLTISIVLSSRLFYVLSGSAGLLLRKEKQTPFRSPIIIPVIFVGFNLALITLFLFGIISGH